MKLRDVEARVLAAIGLRANLSLPELARIVKLRQHVCRRALDSLMSRKILTRRVVVDPSRLGYRIFNLWFSIASKASKIRHQILAEIENHPQVAYFGEFEGEFNYRIDLYVRSAEEVQQFLAHVTGKFGPVFSQRALSCTLSVWDFALKFLCATLESPPPLVIGTADESVTLDTLDHQFLRTLTAHGNEPLSLIARRLGVGVSTLDYRLKRLCSNKVVVGYHMIPEVEMMDEFGIPIHLHRMRLLSFGQSTQASIEKFAKLDKAVWGLTRGVGEFDLELCSAASNAREDREFRARLDAALGDVIDNYTCVRIIRHIKVNNYPFRNS